MSKILVCGDSFCVTDPEYPDLHWSEIILGQSPEYEIYNLSMGGCSNALIVLQLLQGLTLKPDFVVLSFTGTDRYELDKNIKAIPNSLSAADLSAYLKERYTTNKYSNANSDQLKIIDRYMTLGTSNNLEKLKNYFYICFCLQTLKTQNINFCYSLGGFEYQQDYPATINSNFIKNCLLEYHQYELPVNLWYYQNAKPRPYFHVDDKNIQTLFANACIEKIGTNSNLQIGKTL